MRPLSQHGIGTYLFVCVHTLQFNNDQFDMVGYKRTYMLPLVWITQWSNNNCVRTDGVQLMSFSYAQGPKCKKEKKNWLTSWLLTLMSANALYSMQNWSANLYCCYHRSHCYDPHTRTKRKLNLLVSRSSWVKNLSTYLFVCTLQSNYSQRLVRQLHLPVLPYVEIWIQTQYTDFKEKHKMTDIVRSLFIYYIAAYM